MGRGSRRKGEKKMRTAKNYINGKWVEAKDGRRFESYNPATGELLGTLAKGSAEDVNEAVQASRTAFDSWRKYPAPRRGEILYRVGELLKERKEEIARLMTMEMGKVIAEARGDVQEGIDMAYYMGGEGRRQFGMTAPSEMFDKFQMAVRDPVGVVAAITPWNFPMAIPTWKIMPALVCGNTVIFKPASDTSLVAVELVKIFEEAGLPPGVLNLVTGSGAEVGTALLQHPDVDIYSFTGSTESGQKVLAETAGRLKRVSLELGGKNAIMVMEDGDVDLALDGILWSAFGTTGQRCTACSRLILHKAIAKELTEKLIRRAEKLKLGNGLDSITDVGPVVNQKQCESIHEYVKIGQNEGAQIVLGGRPANEGELSNGSFYYPTLFTNVKPDMRIAQEEIFGPVLSIITVDSFEEAIKVNNSTRYGLSSSIYTSDVNRAFTAMREISTGILYINAGTIGAEVHLPFGGTRQTGNGHREAAWAAIDFFTEWKSIYIDYSGKLQRAQIDM
jgi:alpha-ketoglutaric semialdehyde dehydrogenase